MNVTKVDWLGYRSKSTIPASLAGLKAVFGPLGSVVTTRLRKKGLNGFEQAADICLDGMQVGLMQYGGEFQKGWVHVGITGRGCEWVTDWDEADDALSKLENFQPRRVDIALDTFKREVTHETVVAAFRSGQFTTSGKPPSMSCILPEDPYEGRTAYIGARTSEKFLRAYEKGYEIAKGFPSMTLTEINGVPIGDIYRLELELKAKKSPLPEDLIEKRDQYFSGAYPYLQAVLKAEPEVWSRRRERGPQMDLEAALANIKHQYGTVLFTAAMAFQGNISAVWDQIVGSRPNEGLVSKGVLLVEHE